MAYSSRNTDDRYKFRQDNNNPTISKLVQPSGNSHLIDGRTTENHYGVQRQNDDRSTSDLRRTGEYPYESARRTGDDQYGIQRLPAGDYRQEPDRRNNNYEYTRRVPTHNITIDPIRRPSHGNGRTCVMEINIAVTLGDDRTSRISVLPSNTTSNAPAIRSTATLEDAHYVDLHFQSPENTAQLFTDGIIHRSPPGKSTGFTNVKQ